jgi:hypothetical protein
MPKTIQNNTETTTETSNTLYRPKPIKYNIVTGSREMFKLFKEEHPQVNIDSKKYKEVIEALNLYYLNHILETGNVVILPHGLGKIMIQKNKRRLRPTKDGKSTYLKAPVNWKETQKQGKIIYYLNENTDGFTYRYLWFKKGAYINHNSIWCMIMTMQAKKMLKNRVDCEEKDYKNLYRELSSRSTNWIIKKFTK